MFHSVAQMTTAFFQPAFDALHTTFRMLRLRSLLGNKEYQIEVYQILDFYLLFPFRLAELSLSEPTLHLRALAKKYGSYKPYSDVPESKVLFDQMRPFQEAAVASLVARDYFEQAVYLKRLLVTTRTAPPAPIQMRIIQLNEKEAELSVGLRLLAETYPITGHDGLKRRSHLLEYRYDAI
jgi:hypothetical protein